MIMKVKHSELSSLGVFFFLSVKFAGEKYAL